MDKLSITQGKHHAPYTLGWLNDTANIHIAQRAIVPFSIGSHYKDRIYCDVAPVNFVNCVWVAHGNTIGKLCMMEQRIPTVFFGTLSILFSFNRRIHPHQLHLLLHHQQCPLQHLHNYNLTLLIYKVCHRNLNRRCCLRIGTIDGSTSSGHDNSAGLVKGFDRLCRCISG